jgi:hypothetical protein
MDRGKVERIRKLAEEAQYLLRDLKRNGPHEFLESACKKKLGEIRKKLKEK